MGVGFLSFAPERLEQYAAIGRRDADNWSMGPQEGLFICNLLTAIRARRVIEIGAHIGHSSLFICHALRSVGYADAVLHSFEITERAESARKHLSLFGYDSLAHVHQVNSHGVEATVIREQVQPVDVILVDGDHSFEGSLADFLFWKDAVRPGGMLIFHDVSEEFEQTYLAIGLRSVCSTLKKIEQDFPEFSVMRMCPPYYHNSTSMALVQKAMTPTVVSEAHERQTVSVRAEASLWERTDHQAMRQRPWEAIALLSRMYPPTMLQPDELQYLYWLVRDEVQRQGHVVELGAWQGGSTAVLSQGLQDRTFRPKKQGRTFGWKALFSKPSTRVYTFDRFVWDEYSCQCAPEIPFKPGDNTEDVFRKNIQPWAALVKAAKGEIRDASWERHEVIALLFVDAAQDAQTLASLWNTFGPGLRDGSIVVFQDFKHWSTCFLPVYIPLLPGLTPVHVCRDGCAVGFRFAGRFQPVQFPPLDPALVDTHYAQVCEALAWDRPTVVALELSWATQLLHLGLITEAQAHYEKVKDAAICAGAADALHAVASLLTHAV